MRALKPLSPVQMLLVLFAMVAFNVLTVLTGIQESPIPMRRSTLLLIDVAASVLIWAILMVIAMIITKRRPH